MPYLSTEQKRQGQNKRLHRIAKYWLVEQGKEIDDLHRRNTAKETEQYAPTLLHKLGFGYILALNETIKCFSPRHLAVRQTFPFDFYCEQNGQRWFIEVTSYIKKDLSRTPLWDRLSVKIGVLFIRRDLQEYCFKEGTNKSQASLCLKDIGLEPISRSEVIRTAWETRKGRQNAQTT